MAKTIDASDLKARMLELHGPLMNGTALYKALGFNSYLAFQRALTADRLGIDVFPIKGRRGKFGKTLEVVESIERQQQERLPDSPAEMLIAKQ